MQRKDDTDTLRHFRDPLTICQLNEVQRGNKSESARFKWRMSQIVERQSLAEEAKTYRKAAEKARNELAATGDFPKGIPEDGSWDVFLGLLYR